MASEQLGEMRAASKLRANEIFRVATADSTNAPALARLSRLLKDVREVFNMDVVFVSEFKQGRRFFRHVDAAPNAAHLIQAGASSPLDESYCLRVVDGRLPQAIPDTSENAEAQSLAVTRMLPVGAHLSVPMKRADGSLYGTLCCFSTRAMPHLRQDDAETLRDLAGLISATMPELLA